MNDNTRQTDLMHSLAEHGYRWPHQLGQLSSEHKAASLCYVHSEAGVLLLQRVQPPFAGYWTAPGGKLQAGETPEIAVRRELHEETGLTLRHVRLRMMVRENGPLPLLNWLLFIYEADDFTGEPQRSDEGPLRWVPSQRLHRVGMPDVDLIVSRYVLADEPARWAEVSFDEHGRTVALQVGTLGSSK